MKQPCFSAPQHVKRRDLQFSEQHIVLRYSILTLTVLLLIAGSGFLLNLLDPFSSFGRIFSDLFRPVVLVVNKVAVIALEQLGEHTLYLSASIQVCARDADCAKACARRAASIAGKEEAHAARRREVHQRELRGLNGQHGLRRVFRALSDESGGHGAVSESGEQAAQDPGNEAGLLHRLRRMRTRVPSKPYKAIYVDGNPVHQLAKKPVVKRIEEKVDYKEDFPF